MRFDGNDDTLIDLAKRNAMALGAGVCTLTAVDTIQWVLLHWLCT